jgi:hypothetical protein
VRSKDSVSPTANWGVPVAVDLKVDKTGPVASSLVIGPNPTNGKIGYNANTPAVRISAALTDNLSSVAGAEGFIDTAPANVNTRGFSFASADGQFNAATENAYGDIPLSAIAQLSNGAHTLIVRGKDASGNWGANSSIGFTVDKLAPSFTSFSPAGTTVATRPTITLGTASVNVTLNGLTDGAGSGVVGGDYWLDGTGVAPANSIAFAGTTLTVNTSGLTSGVHNIRVRVKDAAGNVSVAKSLTLYVLGAVDNLYTANANTSTNQTVNVNTANGVLTNDEPVVVAGRTATIVAGSLHRVDNNNGTGVSAGTGTIVVAVSANGSFSYTLTAPVAANTNTLRQNAKRGTYSFTYTETLNGVTSAPATVTITVN